MKGEGEGRFGANGAIPVTPIGEGPSASLGMTQRVCPLSQRERVRVREKLLPRTRSYSQSRALATTEGHS
jgi:hypothetical protein